MKQRPYGKEEILLSVIGFGGIVVNGLSASEAANCVSRAVDRGINYFDVAPGYGPAEEILGPALEPHRDGVFLACKTGKWTALEAEEDLQRSLVRLKTDYFDLYQFHGVSSMKQAEALLAPGGAMETVLKAREQGTVRHIGFSAHSEEAALYLLEAFDFDSILFPVNLFCWRDGDFGPRAVEKAGETHTTVLALKSAAKRPVDREEKKKWPKCWYVPFDTTEEIRAALSFTLSKLITAAVCPSHEELLWNMCDALESLDERPVEDSEINALEGKPLFHR